MTRRGLALASCLALGALIGCERESQSPVVPSVARHGCLACHAAGQGTLPAPSFAAISERYAGKQEAAALLAESLKNGSHGKWAEYPGATMPAQSQLSEAERKALVRMILGQ